MLEIIDSYCWEEHKKIITHDQHGIDGLKNVAYWNYATVAPPAPKHFHADILEIHCLLKGKRVVALEHETYTITGNELFITYPNEEHSTSSYETSPCSFIAFQIDLKDPTKLLGLNSEYSKSLYSLLVESKERHIRFTSADAQMVKSAFMNICDGSESVRYLGVQQLTCFLFKIQDFFPVKKKGKTIMDENIRRVIKYIEECYTDNPRLQGLAALSGYSLSRFKCRFKEVVGLPPANYIAMKKLEYAKGQLLETDASVTQIALDAGYSSSNYFCTTMKRNTGYSPHEFREMCHTNSDEKSQE